MLSEGIILVTGANLRDRETILQALGDEYHVVASQTVNDALVHLGNSVHLVICDAKSDQCNGLELMRRWKLRDPDTPFVMLVEHDDTGRAIDAMKGGAADCIVKPIEANDLRTATHELMQGGHVSSSSATDRDSPGGGRRRSNIDIPPDTSLEELERAAVEQALVQHHGNRTHAARTLGISVRTLQRKLKAWGMPLLSVPGPSMGHSFLIGTSNGAPFVDDARALSAPDGRSSFAPGGTAVDLRSNGAQKKNSAEQSGSVELFS